MENMVANRLFLKMENIHALFSLQLDFRENSSISPTLYLNLKCMIPHGIENLAETSLTSFERPDCLSF